MSTRKPEVSRLFIDDLPCLKTMDLRRMVGSKTKLKKLERIAVILPDGRTVELELMRRPGRFGGFMVHMVCPSCGKPTTALRLLGGEQGLVCRKCLQRNKIRYRSQVELSPPKLVFQD